MARERAPVTEVVSGEVVFEVDRFEWNGDERLEVSGRWYGLRGHRFVRPVLLAEADDGPRRMLALLEHKPWAADDGEPWIAAFPWQGEPVEVTSVELAVAPSLAVDLPAPKAPGQRRRKAESAPRTARRGPAPPPAPKPEPERESKPSAADEVAALRAQLEGERETVRRLAAELDDAHARLAAKTKESGDDRERDDREAAIRRERDAAIAERDDARARAERHHGAVADERDAAVRARAAAQQERDEALDQRAAAQFEIKAARVERDAAIAERDRATERQRAAVRDLEALQRRVQAAEASRPAAVAEPPAEPAVRPSAPVRSRALREQTALVVWGQRVAAVIVLIVWAIVVYKVLQGVL
jgi:hypothetical protein